MEVTPHEVDVSIDELVVDRLPRVMRGPPLDGETIGEAIRAGLVGLLTASGPTMPPRGEGRRAGRGEGGALAEFTQEGIGAAVAQAIHDELLG